MLHIDITIEISYNAIWGVKLWEEKTVMKASNDIKTRHMTQFLYVCEKGKRKSSKPTQRPGENRSTASLTGPYQRQ